MRCDSVLMQYPSRYIPPTAEHSMSLQLFWGCGCSSLQRVVDILVCKRSSSDLVRHEENSIEMRCDNTPDGRMGFWFDVAPISILFLRCAPKSLDVLALQFPITLKYKTHTTKGSPIRAQRVSREAKPSLLRPKGVSEYISTIFEL